VGFSPRGFLQSAKVLKKLIGKVKMKKAGVFIFILSIAVVSFAAVEQSAEPNLLTVGEFFNIYNPAVENHKWWLNDHFFILDKNGLWHVFGITDEKPVGSPDSQDAAFLAHATASKLTQTGWHKEPFPLMADPSCGEVHLWAPHIILYNGLYYMYYCAGDLDHTKYKIHLATSKDLINWQRHSANPMVVDGYDARDPFILKLGGKWVMYYTATSKPSGGYHTVEAVVSKDLIHWSKKRRVYTDPGIGTWGGNTESPVVIRRGKFYYLFIGPGDSYITTKVYRSTNPFRWTIDDEVATLKTHAAEIIRDTDGKWFISHCGIGRDGLWLAPLKWNDGIDDSDTSCQLP
jgi:beta-fructofuranosidase